MEENFSGSVNHNVRNATGGKVKVMYELKKYFQDIKKQKTSSGYNLVIVSIDGNCKGFLKKQEEVVKKKDISKYYGEVICAIPDPHIERWYITDGNALRQVIGVDDFPICPTYKCKKGIYKGAIMNYLSKNNINVILGGAEYGDDVARVLNLQQLAGEDQGFNVFVSNLKSFIRRYARLEDNV